MSPHSVFCFLLAFIMFYTPGLKHNYSWVTLVRMHKEQVRHQALVWGGWVGGGSF